MGVDYRHALFLFMCEQLNGSCSKGIILWTSLDSIVLGAFIFSSKMMILIPWGLSCCLRLASCPPTGQTYKGLLPHVLSLQARMSEGEENMSANVDYRLIKIVWNQCTSFSLCHHYANMFSSNLESKLCFVCVHKLLTTTNWAGPQQVSLCILLSSNLNSIKEATECEHIKQHSTYKELALVEIFAAPVWVFNFFAEDQGHFEEEEVSVTTLTDESLGIPNLKGLLEDQLSLRVNVPIKTWSVETRGRKARCRRVWMCVLYVQTCWWVGNEGKLNKS